jgi:hypothetical protein
MSFAKNMSGSLCIIKSWAVRYAKVLGAMAWTSTRGMKLSKEWENNGINLFGET